MKIVAILFRSDGNEGVGEMWRETKVFEDTTPILEIMQWAYCAHSNSVFEDEVGNFRGHLEITIDQGA